MAPTLVKDGGKRDMGLVKWVSRQVGGEKISVQISGQMSEGASKVASCCAVPTGWVSRLHARVLPCFRR